mmetsp:Transcript_14787/g.35716  ORF Transcript_14787/g.35716 Transcript_14787/m.35716 type:complete len:338 (+) Transcript_14787:478-1491(+)
MHTHGACPTLAECVQHSATCVEHSRECAQHSRECVQHTILKPCFMAASQVRSIFSSSIAPTSWWVHFSRAWTRAPAWHACTSRLCIVISHDLKPAAFSGRVKAGSLVYTQSLRSSSSGGTTNWWKAAPLGALCCSSLERKRPTTQHATPSPSAMLVEWTRFLRNSSGQSLTIPAYLSSDCVSITTVTPRFARYSEIPRPSLDVAPSTNAFFTSAGIVLMIAAAVRVLPCTTRIVKSGWFLTKSAPPPLSASFLFSAPSPNTLTPALSASVMAASMALLMRPHWLLKKKSMAHAGVTHVSIRIAPNRCLSATKTVPNNLASSSIGTAIGQRMYIHIDG